MERDRPRIPTGNIDDVIFDVEALARLHEVRSRCGHPESDFESCLGAILDTAIFLGGAEKGTLQLLDADAGMLTVRAHRGFQQPFLELLSRSDSPLGSSAASVCAVHSTPLMSSSERVYGVISIHFAGPTLLDGRKKQLVDMLALQAADYLERKQAELLLVRLASQPGTLVAECSRDLRYLFVNEPYADFLRKPVELILGRSIPGIIGDAGFQVIVPYIHRVLAGERVEYEAEIPYANVGSRHMHAVYVPGFDLEGTVCGWIATISEIGVRSDASAPRRSSRRWHMRHGWAQACRSSGRMA